MLNSKNSVIVYYTIQDTEFKTELVLPHYDWQKDNPNEWTNSAEYLVNSFICDYTSNAGFNIIKDFKWCFSYVDLKYIDTPEYTRKLSVELTR